MTVRPDAEHVPALEEVGQILREMRGDVGLSIVGLALRVGISEQTVSRYELARQRPRESTLRRIVGVLVALSGERGIPIIATADELVEMIPPEAMAPPGKYEKRAERRRNKMVRLNEQMMAWMAQREAERRERAETRRTPWR